MTEPTSRGRCAICWLSEEYRRSSSSPRGTRSLGAGAHQLGGGWYSQYLEDREDFMEKYNAMRPKAETMFSSLKRTIAHWLRSRKKRMQRKEAYAYIIAYNVARVVINPLRLI